MTVVLVDGGRNTILTAMNPNALLALAPIVNIGGSVLLSWLVTLLIIGGVVAFIIWLVKQFAGPPSIPDPYRWILWVIVAIGLIVFIFMAFGIHIP